MTIDQRENYGRKVVAYLPTIEWTGKGQPVVRVIDEKSGQFVYTLRIKGKKFRPPVFAPGLYTINVGHPGTPQMVRHQGVKATKDNRETLRVGPVDQR